MKNNLIINKKLPKSIEDLDLASENLERLLLLPLEQKILIAKRRIEQFMEFYDGKCYISFSGGKDSTVLLNLIRSMYPNTVAVFVDTGLEYPEIREFVKTCENVIWIKPKKTFNKVIEDVGYPIISKEVSLYINDLQNPTPKNRHTRRIRLEGSQFKGGKKTTGKLSEKWLYLIDAPFKISSKCCDILKKEPAKRFEKETGLKPFIGTMASESRLRTSSYIENGCNVFTGRVQSRPLSIWTDNDIWEYIRKHNLPYSKIYDMGYSRTGCMFCGFGCHLEDRDDNRFIKMSKTHPKQHNYCINKLGMGKVLDFIDVPYTNLTEDNFLEDLTKPKKVEKKIDKQEILDRS